jgi:hypothetical protein
LENLLNAAGDKVLIGAMFDPGRRKYFAITKWLLIAVVGMAVWQLNSVDATAEF